MYLPAHFKETELPVLHAQMEGTRLAMVVTSGTQGLQASHLPLLLRSDEGDNGTLYGHFAKANPQWRDVQEGTEVLVIFSGADAYISPSFYPAKAEHGKVVPTWNYLAVHVYGQAEVFTDHERLLRIVSGLTEKHEASRAEPWAVSDAPADYIEKMLNGIVGFALPIARLEGKRKLNQNRSADDIAGVSKGLAQSPNPFDQHIAQLMSQGTPRV